MSKLNYFKYALINFLKGEAVKLALKKLLGSAIVGGPKAWAIQFIISNLFDEIAKPIIKAAFTEIGYYFDVIEGKLIIKKLEEARADNDKKDYERAIDSIFTK